jgi:hypothetical protein
MRIFSYGQIFRVYLLTYVKPTMTCDNELNLLNAVQVHI